MRFPVSSEYDISLDRAQDIVEQVSYHRPYRAILELANSIHDDELGDGVTALACTAYGWMPTILKTIDIDQLGISIPEILVTIRKVDSKAECIDILQSIPRPPVNNSWVGTSKLLHFINPRMFPIFDSRIAKKLGWKHRYQWDRKASFLSYVSHMLECLDSAKVVELQRLIEDRFDYRPTKLRCMELHLFANG